MIFLAQNRIAKWIMASFLMLSIVTLSYGPIIYTPHKAEAAIDYEPYNTIVNAADWVVSKVSQAYEFITSHATNALWIKEYVLDPILWGLANAAIQQLSRSIINWINSGFQGSPSFVTDFEGFMLGVADQAMGAYLEKLGLGFLCSPFQLDIQIALDLQYRRARNQDALECTLSGIVGNVENFFANNSLGEGGWQSWFALTTRPANNPYGALVVAQSEASIRLTNAQGKQFNLLNFGSGFLTYHHCENVQDGMGGLEEVCSATTPGKVIEKQLNNNLDSGRERLIIADEIDEILGALFAQIVQQTFTGVGGLLGLTGQSYSSNGTLYPSYLDAAAAADQNYIGAEVNPENPIVTSIETEDRWLSLQERTVSMVNNAELYERNTFGTTTCSSRGLPQSLESARQNALEEINLTENNIIFLDQLLTQYENTNDPNVQLEVQQTYAELLTGGVLHNETEIALYEVQVIGDSYTGLIAAISNYQNAVSRDCQNFFDNED